MNKKFIYLLLSFYFLMDNLSPFLSDFQLQLILLFSLFFYVSITFVKQGAAIFTKDKKYLWLFLIFSVFSGIANLSVDLILGCFLIAVPFIFLNSSINISVKFINALFLLQIGLSAISYYLGTNIYGFLPGHASETQYWWRISLFAIKSPPYTGFIASLVLLFNIYENKSKDIIKWLMFGLLAYWIILSGSRTIYLFWIMFIFFNFFYSTNKLNLKSILPYLFLGCVLVIQTFIFFITKAVGSIDLFAFLIRTQEYSGTKNLDLSRQVMYEFFFDKFINNPFFGIGEIGEFYIGSNVYSGSEVWFISLFAAIGFGAIFLNLFFIAKLRDKLKSQNYLAYWTLVLFVLSFMLYSSYLKPYNYATVLCIILILNNKNNERKLKKNI